MTVDEELEELIQHDRELEQLELLEARDSLAVYAGLQIPQDVERDDVDDPDDGRHLLGLDKLSLPARYVPAEHHRLIIEKLEAIERGYVIEKGQKVRFKRLMIFAPPGSAKSSYGSVFFPAWYLGRNPRNCVIQGSYNNTQASRFGRRARNTFASQVHHDVFGIGLGKSAEGDWETERGGEYFCFGMKTGVTSRRADLVVLDDPIKGRKEADSETERNNVWETYKADVRTRMKPGAAIVYIACMTGDTPVLMADGNERPLREIRPGDRVGTYDEGRVTVSTVLNWINHGPDRVFAIRMKSGIVVKANARHPFLVEENGEVIWQRTATLKKGSVILKVTGEKTEESRALWTRVKLPRKPKACAWSTTARLDGRPAFGLHRTLPRIFANVICDIVTGSISKITTAFSQSSEGCAPSVSSPRRSAAPKRICASIIATTARRFGGFCATIATSLSAMARQRKRSPPPLSTCEITRDTVVEIVEGGTEDVFDIEVERTENFIAAGLVSHNTRWHEDDPAGRILPEAAAGKSGWFTAKDGERWYVLSLNAVIETEEEAEDDPLGRDVGEILWPEWFSPEMFEQEKRTQGSRNWAALYKQKPRADEGEVLKRQYWRCWPSDKPPKCEYVVSVYDTAFEEGEEDDYSARTTWGIFEYEEERPAAIEVLPSPGKKGRAPVPETRYCCILLERFKDKVAFPELRRLAKEHYKTFRPDRILVEKKSSGHSLIQELRRSRVPVLPLKADRSKLARAHASTVVLEDGCVFVLADKDDRTRPRAWALEVIDDCAKAKFTKGSRGNDIGDTCVYAWLYLRRMFHLQLKFEKDEELTGASLTPEEPRRLYG